MSKPPLPPPSTGTPAIRIGFIGGYGRSGSTLLSQILGTAQDVFPVGELSSLFSSLATGNPGCSCGSSVRECPFWTGVLREAFGSVPPVGEATRMARTQLVVESWKKGMREPLKPVPSAYQAIQQELFTALSRDPKVRGSLILDSSKTAYNTAARPSSLSRVTGLELRLVHLVRDPRGVWWSLARRGLNRDLERGLGSRRFSLPTLRTILGWSQANRAAERFALPGSQSIRLRYEDLCSDPETNLAVLSRFLEITPRRFEDIFRDGASLPEMHQIGGNRRRFDLRAGLRPDTAWEGNLPPGPKLAISLTLRRMMERYGYR